MSTLPDFVPDEQFKPDAPGSLAQQVPAGGDFVPDHAFVPDSQKYGGIGQEALTAAEGLAKGVAGPLATGAEALLSRAGVPGLTPGEQAGRESANPWIHGGAEVAGLVAPAIASGGVSAIARAGLEVPEGLSLAAKAFGETSLGGQLEKAGRLAEKIAPSIGIGGPGAGVLAKVGSSAVRGAVENGLYQAGDEASRAINGDPSQHVETALAHVGLGSLIGGGLGGSGGAVSSLWRATMGTKTGAILNAAAEHLGGIEGVEVNPVAELVAKTGMDVPAEVQAGLTNDPAVREMFDTLNQSDTTNSGRAFQQTKRDFEQKAGETLSEALGRDPGQIPEDFDKYSHGKNIGLILADEAESRVGPLKTAYEDFSNKYKGKELFPSISERADSSADEIATAQKDLEKATSAATKAQEAGNPEASIETAERMKDAQKRLKDAEFASKLPGTVDALQEKIGKLATDERWALSPSSDIMKAVNTVQKELPNLKTLEDLGAYIKRIGEATQADPLNGPLMRAGGMMKSILRDAEGEMIGHHIGSEEGAEVLGHYRETQMAYGAEAKLKDELESRLGKLGSTASYAKRIREMAQGDAESVLRKLSGKDDADLLRMLKESFPKTAEAIRQAHVDQLLTKAKVGDAIMPNRIMTSMNKLSPQLQHFIVPEEAASRVGAIGQMLEKLKDAKYNYSSSARTLDKLFQYIPGTAVGMASMLLGHNPAIGLVLGGLTKYVSKDAPDAVRLGLLKWLGSNKPIEAGAFKSMVDMIHNTMKGDRLIDRASKNLFSGASKVIPEHLMPTEQDTKDLDHKIKQLQANPHKLENIASNASYYLPDHAIAMTATATRTAQYLNSIRPMEIKQAPLDSEPKVSKEAKAKFDRALQIAQQPLMIAHLINEGMLTAQDMTHLGAMYPGFSQKLSQQVTQAMIEHVGKGEVVPYRLRFGLSTLLGQPLDSGMAPQAIARNQATFAQSNAREAAKSGAGQTKPSLTGMREMKPSNRLSLSRNEGE